MSFSLFPSFFDCPSKIKFIDQEEDEHIELFLRQHWVTNIGWIITAILGIIFPFVLAFAEKQFNFSLLSEIPTLTAQALLVVWYLLVLAYVLEHYLYWYFNIYIVTNKHLIDVALRSILARDITSVRIDDVQSARSKISGILMSLFNFGDVIIETAAERQQIQFIAIPKPDFVADRIQDIQEVQEGKP